MYMYALNQTNTVWCLFNQTVKTMDYGMVYLYSADPNHVLNF